MDDKRGQSLPTLRLGFIGAGQMATALARGLLSANLVSPSHLIACDPLESARAAFSSATGGKAVASGPEVASASDVVFLAVKPQQAGVAAAAIRPAIQRRHLVVSIVAGVPLSRLAEELGDQPRLVRVMPNSPCLIGQGASAYSLGPRSTRDDGQLVLQLLSSVGKVVEVEEKLLDAVTGLSGSGPAYAFLMIEALADGGVRMGLPRDAALLLAAQTLAGAAHLVLDGGEHPAVLKDRVASPGGTTIRGLQVLEERAVRGALIAAVQAATERSKELAH